MSADSTDGLADHHARVLQIRGVLAVLLRQFATVTEGHTAMSEADMHCLAADTEGALEAALALVDPLLEACTD